jgi:Cys-rich repeat protein
MGSSAWADLAVTAMDVTKFTWLLAIGALGCASKGDPVRSSGTDNGTLTSDAMRSSPNESSASAERCSSDAQCAEGTFCDLGRCVPFYDPRHHGWECDPSRLPEDDPILASKLNPCGAYICRDLRCRSCEGDKDCKEGATCNRGMDEKHPGWACGLSSE